MSETNPCPCGSGASLNGCCKPFIDGTAKAPTAEALMRSRYTAFATRQVAYLEQTLHPTQRSDYDAPGTAKWAGASLEVAVTR